MIKEKTYTYQTALEALKKYCVYQERSHQEVRMKSRTMQLTELETEQAICKLIEDNFLNEERFACAYAKGKFRTKNWGPNKIKFMLLQKGVAPHQIQDSLENISEEELRASIKKLCEKKNALLLGIKNPLQKKQKIIQYLLQKGFPANLVLEIVTLLLTSKNS